MIRDALVWIALSAASLAAFIIEPFVVIGPAVTAYYVAEGRWPARSDNPLWQRILRGSCAVVGLFIGIILRTYVF